VEKKKKKKVNGKKKGNSFELKIAHEVANAIKATYGKYVRRTPGSGSLLTRSDLWVDPKFRHLCNLYIECKKQERWSWDQYFNDSEWVPFTWFQESNAKLSVDPDYSTETSIPCLVFTKNRSKIFAMLSLYDFKNHLPVDFKDISFHWIIMLNTHSQREFVVCDWSDLIDMYKVKE